jgi:hypothetical protein
LAHRRLFEPGDLVLSLTGEVGIVISREKLAEVAARFKEGRRLGRFFSPGCCSNPDYITQVPVFFEDGTFNVMRSMNLNRGTDLSENRRESLQRAMES